MAKQVRLRDGYYIEISSNNTEKPVKVWRETKAQIQQAIRHYTGVKVVRYLGRVENNSFVETEL